MDVGARHLYYRSVFPAEAVYDWMAQPFARRVGQTELFLHVTEDFPLRHVACDSARHLQDLLSAYAPVQVNLGAYYALRADRAPLVGARGRPVGRPLTFDLDRERCGSAACQDERGPICDTCWRERVLPPARELHAAMTARFPRGGVVAVFSGRRGFHLWVRDPVACLMDAGERARLVQELRLPLDEPVTAQLNHTLRLPFSVHCGTGLVAVPFDPSTEAALPAVRPHEAGKIAERAALLRAGGYKWPCRG